MAGEVKMKDVKQRNPKEQKKKRKDGGPSDKHKFSLAEQMDDTKEAPPRNRSAKARKMQEEEEYVTPGMSNKILAEARRQQQEIDDEKDEETGVAAARRAFNDVTVEKQIAKEDSDDEDDEGGYSDNEYAEEEFEEITAEDERIMSMFMASDAGPQRTLADMIMERIKEKDAGISSSSPEGERNIPGIDEKIVEVFRGVGKLLSRFRSGKVPKAFKIVPSLSNWEEVLYITEPEKWSTNAMYQATRLFASNLNARMAQRFYNLVLLPRLRQDINEHKRLHFALYQALKKAVYKPSAFYKGILLPLCQSRTCNLREAVIIGSVIQKVSIPVLHSSVALMKIAEMEYCGTNSYFMKLLMDKKYALPYRVLDAMVAHFAQFTDDERELPVIWHQCLLTFVQRYKNELSEEDKEKLKKLMRAHKHYLVTPEIQRELTHSRHRGQKEGHAPGGQLISRTTVVKAGTEEDIWNLPAVEIEMAEA
ncbi:essential nuclear protein 1 [Marchantia polymorpha subsp. ruderalis]|uniref:Bystin n=2 Tax=Marchantia polymorpha TaxID=3197 RepID=A0AAF6BGU1_MARPO|nr:hypothetical protein MARPO_0048s0058 [Marchantia polymorpha]BBN11225.1 hypothetical protein Mp_5g10140 [Marchantia polymorpha subsp. ruderalis]|eukprot:PTQ38945.1 hypothetical protein MARPO_0048s0058 [Marchantia polymorpha]